MAQITKLGKIKKIELTKDARKPLPGAVVVGALSDGTPIYEGPVPATNPWFKDHEAEARGEIDNGITRVPIMDPTRTDKDGNPVQRWRRNKVTGEAITPMSKAKIEKRVVRYIIGDMGNGSGGPRPVPVDTEVLAKRAEQRKRLEQYNDEFMMAAMEEGVNPKELLDTLLHARKGSQEPSQEAEAAEDQPQPKKRGRPRKKQE